MKYILIVSFVLIVKLSFNQVIYGNYELNPENRAEVTENKEPYSFICHLLVHRRWGGPYPSTGFVINGNRIVTAGHSVGENRKIFKNKIKFIEIRLFEYFHDAKDYRLIAELNYSRSELGNIKAHPKFKGRGIKSRAYDYGYFELKSDTVEKLVGDGFILLKFNEITNPDDTIHLTGYPGDKQIIKEGSMWDKFDLKKNITASNNYLTYGMFTKKGDSGAPIWIKQNDKFYVVGIHNTGYKTCNGGVKVTEDVIEFLFKN